MLNQNVGVEDFYVRETHTTPHWNATDERMDMVLECGGEKGSLSASVLDG